MNQDFSYGVIPVYKTETGFEFLLTQHIEGHWAFPKGHAENDETPLEAAQREFEEETGILKYELDEKTTFSEEYYPQKDGQVVHKTVKYYLGWVQDQAVTPQDEEVQDYAWLDYKSALEKLTFGNSKKILRSVKDFLNQ